MKLNAIIPTLLFALALTGCGGSGGASSASAPTSAPAAGGPTTAAAEATNDGYAAPAGEAPGLAGGVAQDAPASDVSQQNQPAIERLVIKTASLSIVVPNVNQAEAAVRALVEQLSGYIVTAENSGTDENQRTHLTFRIPAERFDNALSGVQGIAQEVSQRTIGGSDVTEEFVDLDSRLRNLEATRDRLLTFLDKATRVEDALSVNQALTDVQGQIEQIRGRMQYLKQSAAMSTIDVYLSPVPVTPIVPEHAWQPLEVARAALQGLIALAQGLVNVAIVLVVWTPLWLPFVLLGRLALRRLRSRTRTIPPAAAS